MSRLWPTDFGGVTGGPAAEPPTATTAMAHRRGDDGASLWLDAGRAGRRVGQVSAGGSDGTNEAGVTRSSSGQVGQAVTGRWGRRGARVRGGGGWGGGGQVGEAVTGRWVRR